MWIILDGVKLPKEELRSADLLLQNNIEILLSGRTQDF